MSGPSIFARQRDGGRRLAREIAALTAIKILILIALSQLFFSAAAHPPASAEDVSNHLFVDSMH